VTKDEGEINNLHEYLVADVPVRNNTARASLALHFHPARPSDDIIEEEAYGCPQSLTHD
jgi:hypothetical protein